MKSVRRGKPSKDEARGLTKEIILQQAIELIGEVGLEKFSVRLLAQRMSVFPSAIYWWIPTRNELLAEAANFILVDLTPVSNAVDWREWLRALFYGYRAAIHKHPHIAPLVASQLLSNAGADFQLTEQTLAVLHRAGFRDEKLLEAYDVVIAAKIGFVAMELAVVPKEDGTDFSQVMREKIEALDEATYPYLCEYRERMMNKHFVTRWENGITAPLDAGFEAHVYTTIEGLRMLLTR